MLPQIVKPKHIVVPFNSQWRHGIPQCIAVPSFQVRYRSAGKSTSRRKLAKALQGKNVSRYDANKIDISKLQSREPSNFVQENNDLQDLIEKANTRIHARFTEPNIHWKNSLNLKSTSPQAINEELEEKFGKRKRTFKPIDVLSSPLDVGDIVELGNSLDSSELCCVVELPVSLLDPRYTFVNIYGDLKFASKKSISLRFPKIFPKELFKDSVLDEKIFKLKERGIKQIGKPKFLTEDAIDDGSKSFFEQALINNGHNLNQLDTFVMPSLMSQMLARNLSGIVAKAWEILPVMNSKLELIHNLLQNSESPVFINVFQLYAALDSIDLPTVEKGILQLENYEDLINYYASLSEKICQKISIENCYESTSLGRIIYGSLDLFTDVEFQSFFAMILALRNSNKLFDGMNTPNGATQFPFSITILPLSDTVELDLTIEHYKESLSSFLELTNYLVDRMDLVKKGQLAERQDLKKPMQYDRIIALMKQYCSSSSQLDATTESFLIKVLRNIPEFSQMKITSSLVYETLFKLRERLENQNPTDWSTDLLKPNTGTSEKSNMEQNFYDQLCENNISVDKNIDSVADLRKDFTSEFIYCIDDAGAHETDDGFSISILPNGLYHIKTYIADMASYLRPNDIVSKIAFERATTVYLSDVESPPIEMLPKSFVKAVELKPMDNVRAMQFGFLYDSLTKSFVDDSLAISPVYVKNLVNITYRDVDLILNNDDNHVAQKISKEYNVPVDVLRKDLSLLYEASKNMGLNRSENTKYNFRFTEQLEKVSKSNSEDDLQLQLKFRASDESKSQELVSEIMIHTNGLVAKFLAENRIPSIYRILSEMPMTENVRQQMEGLDKTSISDTQKAVNFLTGTSFSLYPINHEYIGLGPYCTVTSPLRRFQDLFTHWQLQSFLRYQNDSNKSKEVLPFEGHLMFGEENVSYVLAHISSRSHKLKLVSSKAKNFFIYKTLQALQKTTRFKVMIKLRPSSNGIVEGNMLEYGGVRCTLKSNVVFSNNKITESLEDATKQNLNVFSTVKIGDVIENCKIDDIDLLTGDVIMSSDKF